MHLRLTGEWPKDVPPNGSENMPPDWMKFTDRLDRNEVRRVARERRSLPPDREFDRVITAPPYEATVDLWYPQRPAGMAAVIIREAAGLKQPYLIESVFIRYCAGAAGEMVTRQFVHYLDRSYLYVDELDGDALFVLADVTRRVGLMFGEHEKRLDALLAELAVDPFLERYRDTICSRAHTCPVCSADVTPVGDNHITKLYRGGELGRKLLAEGYETITDVPEERLPLPGQRIQRATLLSRKPHIDADGLTRFLESISYPLHYLDFEAVSSAVPRYDGTHPWEHIPYLFSVHTETAPGDRLTHQWFLMDPHRDQRRELLRSLLGALGGDGTVLVYGAAFEAGILARLAETFPEKSTAVEDVAGRMVDLLQPFNEFAYYHHTQRGKVRLKTVLPILTDENYSDLVVRDGYAANSVYRYLSSRAEDTAAVALTDDLVRYCTRDTLAMVRIVGELRDIVARPQRGRSRSEP
ncbi:MAG: DUF2779 domain-containing protein [Spirochaetia bacterium]